MKYIAHRGLTSKFTIENTLESILLATKKNFTDGVEFDVRLSKDNKVVVYHDKDIEGKYLKDLNIEEIRSYNIGCKIKKAHIPTLEEVLDRIDTNKIIIIELKNEKEKNEELCKEVLNILSLYTDKNIYLQSFNKDIIEILKYQNMYKIGVLVNENNKELLEENVDFYSLSKHIATNELIEKLLSENKEVMLWTINSDKELKVNCEKTYIITDNPLKLQKHFN